MFNKTNSFKVRAVRCAFSIFISFALCFCVSVPLAHSEVRSDDVIVTDTVSARGIKTADCPNIFATSAALKTSSGKLLFSRDADKEVKVASLTKIMTAIVALENASLDTTITVSENAVATGGSNAGLSAGDTMPLSEAIYALMIPSGNDAATAIAESVGKTMSGSTDTNASYNAFIAKMNEKAGDLGCTHTKFTNPHGLDDDEFASDCQSSANDLMIMIEFAMQNTNFSSVVKCETHELKLTNNGQATTKTVNSTDSLLGNFDGACGIKTGTTDLAGYCFAGACERAGEMVYSVVLGSTDDSTRFEDTKNLFNWYFDNLIDYKLVNADNNIVGNVANKAWIDVTVPATLNDVEKTCKIFKFDGNVSQSFSFEDVSGDIKKGDKLGTVTFIQNNKAIDVEDVVAAEDCSGPDFAASISIGFQRFLNLFTNGQSAATSVVLNDTPLVIKFE